MEEFEKFKGKKLRMSTGYSDFEGTLTEYDKTYLTLENAIEIYDYPRPNEYRRKIRKARLALDKIEYYEVI